MRVNINMNMNAAIRFLLPLDVGAMNNLLYIYEDVGRTLVLFLFRS